MTTMNQVMIIGGGKVGRHLATLLAEEHPLSATRHQVTLLEVSPDRITRLQHELPTSIKLVTGSGADPGVLESAGIRRVQVVAAVTGADETNLVIASLARFEFNVPRIIARVNNPKNAWLFTPAMGVDVMLNQADLMAHLIEEEMSLGDMMPLLKLRRGQFSLVEERIKPSSPVIGQAVRDLRLPMDCVLVAIIRLGQLIVPHGDTRFEANDEVLALVSAEQSAQLAAVFGEKITV